MGIGAGKSKGIGAALGLAGAPWRVLSQYFWFSMPQNTSGADDFVVKMTRVEDVWTTSSLSCCGKIRGIRGFRPLHRRIRGEWTPSTALLIVVGDARFWICDHPGAFLPSEGD